ncbi:hypothetical protein ANN_00429 [Periplaneta americana]|uniref:Uncharacterized protein n=1 Tax=Periplaneta americana TaxID=6978 RepID=A0ABQ8TQU0_PERAM|nr:hypothetical protein ANN_00429 [Periplaneta americana]
MAGLCEGGNEPPRSLKARKTSKKFKPSNQPKRDLNLRPAPLVDLQADSFKRFPLYRVIHEDLPSLTELISEDILSKEVNANKTKSKVIRRKIQKINLRILNEAVELVDSFEYLGCTISSNMSCCQEVKRRIAIAKEAFNRKRSIFCGPLEK